AENDGYNALVLEAGLQWRDVALVRTLSRFLRQAKGAFSQDYMWASLRKHAAVAGDIVQLFHARFDPRGEQANDARGAIRWSDRPQDFRTEVLGLCKAQQVKNAVIVPVGAKGGFIPKQLPV